MGLLTQESEVVIHNKTIKHYESLGYKIPKRRDKWGDITVPRGTKIKVKVEDLTHGSKIKVEVKCDNCGIIKNIYWCDYNKVVKNEGKYYCMDCAYALYSIENGRKTRLKNSISFEQWCIENNRQDILNRWDYELNDCNPNEISYCSSSKFYFKCPHLKHKSEIKNIQSFVTGNSGSMNCKACNSFAQWGIDNLGENFLDKYWDYKKNIVNPWEIASQYNKKVWIKCQEKDYHGSYDIKCNGFVGSNARCPYCNKNSGKVHPLDSLGTLYPQVIDIWSDKNKKSPYEYSFKSKRYVWWKCPDGKHEDYYRNISSSNFCNFRCPECQYSQGEDRINNYLITHNFIKVLQENFDSILIDKSILNYYIPQKTFEGLIGIGNGLLSYDFYLLEPFNLLIEYQGQQHEKYYKGFHKNKKDFERQIEHDKRKREYAQQNGIKLLEIWYWDYDNIEKILDEKLLSRIK